MAVTKKKVRRGSGRSGKHREGSSGVTFDQLKKLTAAQEMVESSPDILGGMPVIRGTRIPVYDVAASVVAGISIGDILESYPSLDQESIELAAIFAKAHPPRIHPRSRRQLPDGVVIISDRRMPRRKRGT